VRRHLRSATVELALDVVDELEVKVEQISEETVSSSRTRTVPSTW